jgi:hypothetical protein
MAEFVSDRQAADPSVEARRRKIKLIDYILQTLYRLYSSMNVYNRRCSGDDFDFSSFSRHGAKRKSS